MPSIGCDKVKSLVGKKYSFAQIREHYIHQVPKEFTHWYWRSLQYRPWIEILKRRYCRYRMPERMLEGLLRQESQYNPWLINIDLESNATGLGQFLPGSGIKYGLTKITAGATKNNSRTAYYTRQTFLARKKCREANSTYRGFMQCLYSVDHRFNPFRSLEASVKHLCHDYEVIRKMLGKEDPIGRDWILALQAYYQGLSTVRKGRVENQAVMLLEPKYISAYVNMTHSSRTFVNLLAGSQRIDYFLRILRHMKVIREYDANYLPEFRKRYSPRRLPKKIVADGLARFDRHKNTRDYLSKADKKKAVNHLMRGIGKYLLRRR